jgi:LPS-assembly protein
VQKNIFFLIILFPFLVRAEFLCPNKTLFPVQVLDYNYKTIKTTADNLEILNKNKYSLSGKVIVKYKDYILRADKAILFKKDEKLLANKNVQFQSHKVLITANSAEITKKKQVLKNIQYQLPTNNSHGFASTITIDNKETLKLANATYSTCPIGEEAWVLDAKEIILDKQKNDGTAYNVILKFYDIPIFYLPVVSWALQGGKTGFLAPSFSSYNNTNDIGSQINIAYYFNLANDKDLLLTHNHLSSRGDVVEAKYRQLFTQGNLEIKGSFLDKDRITDEQRWLWQTKLNTNLSPYLNFKLNVNRVSDKNYLANIKHQSKSAISLNSDAKLKYQKEGLFMSVLTQEKQIINTGKESYYRSPEINIKKTMADFSLNLINTSFKHKNKNLVSGDRRHIVLEHSKKIKNSAYFLSINSAIKNTVYTLKKQDNENRTLFDFKLDGHLNFKKRFQNGIYHNFRPRIFYGFTTKKEQVNLPIFDTSLKSFSYDNLFTNNHFTGIDRISAANDWTVALENTVVDNNTLFEFKIAQKFYGDKQLNSTAQTYNERKYSDIASKMSLLINNYSFVSNLRWNPLTNKVVKRISTFGYKNNKQFFTLAHHKINEEDILEFYTGFNINKNLKFIAGINKSETNQRIKKSAIGLIYENCCWAVKLIHLKQFDSNVNNVDEFSKITQFELIFKGLGSSSPKTDTLIKEYIPSYE